jgi:hypothetical protein
MNYSESIRELEQLNLFDVCRILKEHGFADNCRKSTVTIDGVQYNTSAVVGMDSDFPKHDKDGMTDANELMNWLGY